MVCFLIDFREIIFFYFEWSHRVVTVAIIMATSDNQASNRPISPEVLGVLPVYVRNNSLPAFEQKEFSTSEICLAAEKISGFGSVIGAQRIYGLWRIYPNTTEARQKILVQGLVLRGVRVRDKNPFIISSSLTEGRMEIPTTKLIINNVPISFSDQELLKVIENLPGCEVRSKLFKERD